jgi:peptide/nickel transport system substrate-binding protein
MSRRTRRIAPMLVLGAVGLTSAGCPGDRAPRQGGTAVVVYAGSPRMANPLLAADAYSAEMSRYLLFLPLLEHGPRLELEPRLAESWALEGDTAAVFRLHRGVFWTDGVETNAHDVVFTLERALDAETGYPNRAALDHVEEVVAVDSFTVRVRFRPVRDPIDPVALLPILPRHALVTLPAGELAHAPFNTRPVTNGPFRLAEARPGDRWVFAANEAFPQALGGRPRLDRLVWREVAESASQIAELVAGETDVVVGARPEALGRVSRGQGIRPLERPTLSYVTVAWNGRRPPLNDARVRRALTHAMDRSVIVEALRGGHGRVAAGPVPPGHWAASSSIEPLPYDPDAARSLLEEAGYGPASPLRLTLLLPAGSDFNRDLAQVIQSDLGRVGVRVELRTLEFATLVQTVTGPRRDFDAVLLALDADPRLDLRSLFHSDALDGPFQVAGYSNPELDSVLTGLETRTDRRAALPLWERAQELVAHDQPWTFLYYLTDLVLVRDRLHGVEADLRGVLHSAARWWVE